MIEKSGGFAAANLGGLNSDYSRNSYLESCCPNDVLAGIT
jgi:hypothetical protein